MAIWRLLLSILIPCSTFAQVSDDFSDGNLTSDPVWFGNRESFIVNKNGQLQLNHIGAGKAHLSTPTHVTEEAVWQLDLLMDFNPSARNFCRVYLISNRQDLSEGLTGYYLLIGGAQDQVSLYRQDYTDHVEIIGGAPETTNKDVVDLSIRVTRDANGIWKLFIDDLYFGEVLDKTYLRTNYFGLYCQFTTTRANSFFFDNIEVSGKQYKDLHPPAIDAIRTISDRQIEIIFDEPVIIERLEQILIPGLGTPVLIEETSYASWQFTFPFSFENQQEYTLELTEISDLSGNRLNERRKFTYWEFQPARKHDVVITEVMADPVPGIQLPEVEYLEILNKSEKAINLKNWLLSDQTTQTLLPEYVLAPGAYLILYPRSEIIPEAGNGLALNPWPSLNNSGDLIVLADSTGDIIHFVHYNQNWYKSDAKRHGGWSLELVDHRYPCSGFDNWTASESSSGGTPGFANSVATDNPDLTPPVMIGSFAENPQELELFFDQPLNALAGSGTSLNFEPPLRVDTFFIGSEFEPSLTVHLIDSLKTGIIYQIKAFGLADCNNNINHGNGSVGMVGLAQTAARGDLIINELLFNPRPLGVRFVELFNRSHKPINLKDWRFARWQDHTLVDFSYLSTSNLMIYPDEYRVFTTSVSKLKSHYPRSNTTNMIEVDELPGMGEKWGSLALIAQDGEVLDSLYYSEDMHHALLIDKAGVSLERADPKGATNDVDNWYSGSETNGYASPGFQNSQAFASTYKDRFAVEPKVISSWSNGFPAYARISYTLDQPGSSGTLLVFDRRGSLVRTLLRNSLLSTKGTFQWDGTDDQSRKVPMGHYVVYFKVTSKDFSTQSWAQTIAVAPDRR
jgi:hypothetical protein